MKVNRKTWKALLVPTAVIVFSLAAYLIIANFRIGIGFPLDDAWIHQTYARNLGELGEWAFIPGQKSAGSTGPLWSGLLSLAYLLSMHYALWTYLLGGLALLATAYIAGKWFARRIPERSNWRWVVTCWWPRSRRSWATPMVSGGSRPSGACRCASRSASVHRAPRS